MAPPVAGLRAGQEQALTHTGKVRLASAWCGRYIEFGMAQRGRTPVRIRETKPQRKRPTFVDVSLLAAGTVALILLSGALYVNHVSSDLPSLTRLERFEPSLITRIYSADGEVIKELYTERRVLLPLDQIPAAVVDAFISTEDIRFYEQSGLK